MDLSSRQGRAAQGRRIQVAAEAAGLSLAELARQLGCSRALLYQYLGGQVLAQPDRLQHIAGLCGRSLAWFYTDDDEPLPAAERDLELDRLRRELEADKLAHERGRARELVDHLEALADAQAAPPEFTALRRTCERLAERARDLDDPRRLAEAEFRLGNACYALGEFEATRAALTRAIDLFRDLDLPDRERAARQTLGGALAGLGERDRALAEFDAVVAGGELASQWRGRLGRADVFEALGRGEDALAELAEADRLLADQPDSPARRYAELYVAGATVNVYLLNDDFAAALEVARRCEPLAEELACVAQHIEARLNLGYAQRHLGDWVAAAGAFDDAVRLARLAGDRERTATAIACRAELWAVLGLPERARAEGKDALAAALSLGSARGEILAHAALVEAYGRFGDDHEALYHARQGLAAAAGQGWLKLEALLRCRAARIRRRLGEAGAAPEARRALALAEAVGARRVQGLAALELAYLSAAGEAAEHLRLAGRLADETGAWELRFEVDAAAVTLTPETAGVVDRLRAAVERLFAQRDALTGAGVEAGLLEDVTRLTAVRGLITLLRDRGDPDTARAVLEAAAWPPLTVDGEQRPEE